MSNFSIFPPNNYALEDFDIGHLCNSNTFQFGNQECYGNPVGFHDGYPGLISTYRTRNGSCTVNSFCNSTHSTETHTKKRGASHKLIEWQRRKEMTDLYSKLKSLLPEENCVRKASVADQVLEAVNYVGYLKQKITDLSEKIENNKGNAEKDQAGSSKSVLFDDAKCPKSDLFKESKEGFPSVKINSFGSAFKISINAVKNQPHFSDILVVLEEDGLEVVSAASFATNDRAFHTIHTEVSDPNTTDIYTLSEKLLHFIRENDN